MTALDSVVAALLAERYAGEWWMRDARLHLPPPVEDDLAGVRRRREVAREVKAAERKRGVA